MNPQIQNTTALRDIHLPDAVSWWPPAPGWWIILIVFCVAIYLIPKLYKRLTYVPLNKISQQAFDKICSEYNQNNNSQQLIQSLSKLLRQISMTYHGREEVAQLTGDAWVESLNKLTEKKYFSQSLRDALINAPYKKNISLDVNALLQTTQNWLNALPKKANSKNAHRKVSKLQEDTA